MQDRTSWRQILKQHGARFLEWLQDHDVEIDELRETSRQLEAFLVSELRSTESAIAFWESIPLVRAACNNQATYDEPWAAEAYAYVHFFERYRRMWAVLKHLTALYVLPLGVQGVRTLDVGAGPSPVLYAVDDFYRALGEFAKQTNASELTIPSPTLDSIECSRSMVGFVHHFSESAERHGPFGPTFADFAGLNLRKLRQEAFSEWKSESYWDDETQTWEEYYDPEGANFASGRLFRYRLVVFSNFLTLSKTVDAFRTELTSLMEDLAAGAIVVILGATNDSYQTIYEKIEEIAIASEFVGSQWDTDLLAESMRNEEASKIIKESQHRIYQHIEGLAGSSNLSRDRAWPDYWNESPSSRARSTFALRVFRRGKWPLSTT